MRIVTALVGIPIVVALTWLGGWWTAAMVAGIAVAAQVELYRMLRARGIEAGGGSALAAGACLALTPVHEGFGAAALVLTLVTLGAWPVRGRVDGALAGASATVFGIIYPAGLLAFVAALRLDGSLSGDDAFLRTIGVIVLVWAADTGAYYAGRAFGKHALAPSVSPKKTWEGFAGGVAAALVVAWAIATWGESETGTVHWLALGFAAAVAGPVGDLFESALKRDAGIKDSAGLLPGHGGFLDRFDALAFVAPIAWLYLRLVAGA